MFPNTGFFAHIRKSLIETWNIFAYMCRILIVILDCKVFQHWIICTYTQFLNRDVEVFCVLAQKFLLVILDNKSSNPGLFAYMQRRGKFLRMCAETPKSIANCIISFVYVEVFCASLLLEFIRVHTQKILIVKSSNFGMKILQRWTIKIIFRNICVRTQKTFVSL